MTTITSMAEHDEAQENPGYQLARLREKKGFTQEYIALKLHLRLRVIELLEADDYQHMPEPVFIKGYIRAYAKLLGISAEPFLLTFDNQYTHEQQPEKALWQSRRESNKSEKIIRWVTGLVAVAVIITIAYWWQLNKEMQSFFTAPVAKQNAKTQVSQKETNEKLTDLSRMQSMFLSNEEVVGSQRG